MSNWLKNCLMMHQEWVKEDSYYGSMNDKMIKEVHKSLSTFFKNFYLLDDYIEDRFSLPPFSMDHGLLIRTCVDKPKEVILKCPLVLRHPVIFRLKFTFYVVYNNTKEESLVQISIYPLDPPQLSMID